MTTATPTDTRKADFEGAKLAKRLRRLVGQAIADYSMIEAGDKVMACLSGGKDSYAMLDVLMRLREKSPVPFTIVAVNLDQRHPGFPEHVLPGYLESLGEADLGRKAKIPLFKQFMGTDEITLPVYVGAMFDYHLNDHAGQIAKIRKANGMPDA